MIFIRNIVSLKKIILILILLPFCAQSQKIKFTDEENKFADEQFEKLRDIKFSDDAFHPIVEGALAKVPYHPKFVHAMLDAKLFVNDFKFVCRYCSSLDDNYLSAFQNILNEICSYSYIRNHDFTGLKNRLIPLMEDKNSRELYLSAYYLGVDNDEEFQNHAKFSISKVYPSLKQMFIRDQFFVRYMAFLIENDNEEDFSTFLKDYESTIFSSDLEMPYYINLMGYYLLSSDFAAVEKLSNHVRKLNPFNYRYLYPIYAWSYGLQDQEALAIEFVEKSFRLEDSDFKIMTEANMGEGDVFPMLSMAIRSIKDFKTKERLVEQGITYFENQENYKVRFKLYQSLLYAAKEIKKAESVLKECKPYLTDVNFKDLEAMIKMENELGKDNPNYRLVDELMNLVLPNIKMYEMKFQKILYRYKVNYNSKKPVFTVQEIVNELNELLQYPLSNTTRQTVLHFKILFIAENDRDWAQRELDKLSGGDAIGIVADFKSIDNNPEKASEILISSRKSLKDINNINFINVTYINKITLKE